MLEQNKTQLYRTTEIIWPERLLFTCEKKQASEVESHPHHLAWQGWAGPRHKSTDLLLLSNANI